MAPKGACSVPEPKGDESCGEKPSVELVWPEGLAEKLSHILGKSLLLRAADLSSKWRYDRDATEVGELQ